jgi:gliding motility-associated-like protein
VTVYDRAVLDFEVDEVYLGETSTFINNSTIYQGNLTYAWFFQDGQTSILTNPTHDYTTAGSFDVMLVSTSSLGNCTDTVVETHVVNDQTKAEFSVDPVCLYDSAQFVNESFIAVGTLTYAWEFGDGNTSTEENPKHLYENPGTYLVKLTATSNLGSVSEFTSLLTIYPLPSANFVANDVCDEVSVVFSNLSSISGGTMTYAWSFGDGNSSQEFQPEHLYSQEGTYSVEMIASSSYGCNDTVIFDVIVHPLPMTLFYVDAVCDGFPSMFRDSTKIATGSITDFLWNFGDGTNSIEQFPEKQFLNPSSYTVQLTATSDLGCEQSYLETVKVYAAPVANFSVQNVCFKEAVVPTNLSTTDEGQMSHAWDFGDGTTSIVTSPERTYVLPNTYYIKLVTSTEFGCVDSIYNEVTVHELPTIESGEDQTISQGYSATLSATGGTDYIWTPSESLDNQGVAEPIATPFETTTYTVSVTDDNGCKGVASTIINVEEDFKLEPSNVVTPDGNNMNDTWFVKNITSFPDSEVNVYDRWGKRVLQTTNYQNDWAGTNGTDVLADGEYYYFITSSGSDKVYKGTITILRNNQ